MSLLSIINSVLRCTIRYFRHETALFSARMLHARVAFYSIADRETALDGGAYGIPAPRCRVTYNVGHGDAWVSALGCAHRRAPAPPIRSIYRLRRSVHGVRYSSRRERRDCDRLLYYYVHRVCIPYTASTYGTDRVSRCYARRFPPLIVRLSSSSVVRLAGSCDVSSSIVMRMYSKHLSEYSQCLADATLRCRRYENG